MNIPTIIAIDGPAASGKSTLAAQLAKDLGYLYFDTGVMYRAVTYIALKAGVPVDQEKDVTALAERIHIDVRPPAKDDGRMVDVLADGEDISWEIRRPEVEANVSQVSAYPGVRKAMTVQQRRIGQRGHVVMVGRDIGTVVLPEAGLKVYLDASVEERARRRYEEQRGRGGNASYEDVLASMRRRDQIDSTRTVAPLRPAEDARIINSDHMNIQEVLRKVKELL